MPDIDITTMGGEMPRMVAHLLPQSSATIANNCHFRHGVITPNNVDAKQAKVFSITPGTIFNYHDDIWFAWNGIVDAIRSPVANDDYDRVYFTDGTYPKVTSNRIATQGQGNYPAAHFRLGIPAPEHAIVIGGVTPPADPGEDDPTDDESRFYVETYVTEYGEEGPPGPASAEVTIVYPGSSVALQLQPPGTQNSNITRRRIYRSATSDSTADFLLVAELEIAIGSYDDSLSGAELSAALETYDYMMPPEGMIGLCAMKNGICAGFKGNEVMFSEAYLPYAWKPTNRQTTMNKIVAIAPVGTSLVVGTEGDPYLFSGITPSNISSTEPNITLACVSRQSMVAMDGFAIYASPNGIVTVDASGNALVATEKIIEQKQWRKMFNPTSIRAWRVENEYLALYDTPDGSAGFIFNPQMMDIRHITGSFDAGFNDEKSDTLYIVKGTQLCTLQGGDVSVSMRWRSKPFLAPYDTSFSCLRVMSDQLFFVGINIIVDGAQVLTLPPGTMRESILKLPPISGRKWMIETWGRGQVDRITLSTSMMEMPV
ncbi:hypothetical protein [Serratia marcescens]|uniref:hypothetical protein n=1 Tax=Serratia marcescens TaxID=615 RepID=UPI0007601DF0|nr:hypothetical protein [Serratia marcescens]